MRRTRGWKFWEDQVNTELGLESTVSSGSQDYDKGDGVDRSRDEYAYQVDAKYTESASFSVNGKKIADWVTRAAHAGKKFAVCVRIWDHGDYAVIPFDDFVDLVEKARHWERNA